MSFSLDVPKNNFDTYCEHVLKLIYGVDFATDTKIVSETDSHYTIEFRSNSDSTFINVLPPTIIAKDKVFFDNESIIDDVKELFEFNISARSRGKAGDLSGKPMLLPGFLSNLVMELANRNIIQKYLPRPIGYFCVADNIPFFIHVNSRQEVSVEDLSYLSFDFDDGFTIITKRTLVEGIENNNLLIKLNLCFKYWKAEGDITKPLFPPNDHN